MVDRPVGISTLCDHCIRSVEKKKKKLSERIFLSKLILKIEYRISKIEKKERGIFGYCSDVSRKQKNEGVCPYSLIWSIIHHDDGDGNGDGDGGDNYEC